MLDPTTVGVLAQIADLGSPPVHIAGAVEARRAMRKRQMSVPPGPAVDRVEQVAIPTAGGTVVAARVFVPSSARATVAFFHGGGWVLGDLDGFDHYARRLAVVLASAVVMVDYRLAPEHRFPTALDDAWAATLWADEERRTGRLPSGPLIVLGESSGGNLAAAVAQRACREGVRLDLQVLIYPVLDHDLGRASYLDPGNQLLVDSRAMAWFWEQYVPDRRIRDDPRASPIHGDLAGLPVTVIATAEHDVLRDEGEDYARRLEAAGVPVIARRFDGQMHGFATMPVLPGSEDLLRFLAVSVEQRLRHNRSSRS